MTQELNLNIGIEEYIEHLTATGQKPSTIGTAKRSLALFQEELGPNKVIAKILPVHVAGFFNGARTNTQPGKDGPKPRARASILQIRRIIRAALVWWKEQGYLETVPLPKDERHFLKENKGKKTKTVEPAPAPEASDDQPLELSDDAKAGLKAQANALNNELLGSDEPTEAKPEPATDQDPDPATQHGYEQPEPANDERQYVHCPKTDQRRAVEVCLANGCFSKAQAKRCPHWKQWKAEGLVSNDGKGSKATKEDTRG